MKKEIEIKFKLNESDLAKFKEWINKNAEFVGDENHFEIYMNNPANSFKFKGVDGIVDSSKYLRIRKQENKNEVNFKNFHEDPNNKGHHTHSDEYEFEVTDYDETLRLFEAIGFTDNIEMSKTRSKYNYKNFEIVIDTVKNLGEFIEIEIQEDTDNVTTLREKLFNLLREIGIKEIKLFGRGYISMLINPKHDFGEDLKL